MKEKKLKIANIGDWSHRGGHLYVAGTSQKDMVVLLEQARCKVSGKEYDPSYHQTNIGEFRTYSSMGCWGNAMNGVVPERGVWWSKKENGCFEGKPVRVI
jgi:hypothetical protein